jgi:hypothetical protein
LKLSQYALDGTKVDAPSLVGLPGPSHREIRRLADGFFVTVIGALAWLGLGQSLGLFISMFFGLVVLGAGFVWSYFAAVAFAAWRLTLRSGGVVSADSQGLRLASEWPLRWSQVRAIEWKTQGNGDVHLRVRVIVTPELAAWQSRWRRWSILDPFLIRDWVRVPSWTWKSNDGSPFLNGVEQFAPHVRIDGFDSSGVRFYEATGTGARAEQARSEAERAEHQRRVDHARAAAMKLVQSGRPASDAKLKLAWDRYDTLRRQEGPDLERDA